MLQEFYVCKHNDLNVRHKSSSGGAFVAITNAWFDEYKNKAVVYGCVIDSNLEVLHIRAINKVERDKMCGSKYVSSKMTHVYKNVKDDIENGLFVLFSGTPCQVAALKSFLIISKVHFENKLLFLEVICHGVGSNLFFEDYVKLLENKYRGKAIGCKFRAKSKPWKKQDMEIVFDNNKKYNAPSTNYDWFYSVYLKNYILRPACYKCKFAQLDRVADISLADYWSKNSKEKDKEAESLVVCNTDLGKIWFTRCNDMIIRQISWAEVKQPNMIKATEKPADYDQFWNIYKNNGYYAVQVYVGNNTFKGRCKYLLVTIVDRLNLVFALKKIKRVIKRKGD